MATPKIDAFFARLSHIGYTPEQWATYIGMDPAMCEERLRDAAAFYVPEYRLRDDPNAPESLGNQQSSMGIVVLYRKLAAYSQHR